MNIELTDVTRTFGRNKAVDGVSLAVGPGVFGLLGPNGAGKTSLLRMLATVLPPSSGTVRLLDRDPGKPAARTQIRRRLGYLPQHLGYYPSFTVAEFVEYFALLKEMPAHQVPKAVAAAVERVDLGPRARARLRTLSGGMLRRVGIAQAIVNGPDLLLLDEPTAGLDPEQRVAFRALIRDLGQHATVVVSTHLVEDVGTACSEVADQGAEPDPLLGVKAGGRLVEQQQVRVVHERLRDPDPAQHAAGQRAQPGLRLVPEVNPFDGRGDGLADAARRDLLEQREVLDELHDGERRVVAEVLRQVAEAAADLAAVCGVPRVPAQQPDLAGRRRQHGREHAQQGGLARAVRPQQAEHAGAGIQAHAVDRPVPPERPGDAGQLNVHGVLLWDRVA